MSLIGAAAILVANGGANRPRGPNIHREGCISAESDRTSVRLDRNEVNYTILYYTVNYGHRPLRSGFSTANQTPISLIADQNWKMIADQVRVVFPSPINA